MRCTATHPFSPSFSCTCPLPAAEAGFVPNMVFPFVKLFAAAPSGTSPEACFELAASLMVSWARGWFDRFPHPPVGIMVRMQVCGGGGRLRGENGALSLRASIEEIPAKILPSFT